MDPEAILAGLNEEQRAAATATSGPVVILAGAGTGKTRVISHRVAYAVATGVVDPRRVLVVTFTDRAATEMKHRLRLLGLSQVATSTFHAAAKRQLEYHWPRLHDGPPPRVVDSKLPIVIPLARALPGGYRFTAAKDLADEIEWAKARRIAPGEYASRIAQSGHETPIPPDIFGTLYRRYEQAKSRAGALDFEDMLANVIGLYETDADAAALVRRRYAWFSVDEYQDTNRLQEDLLRLWLGDRRDLCVVGDPDQTIYSFTGASAEHLTGFADRYRDATVVRLSQNYRSTPQVLALANRLVPGRELRSTGVDGPMPELVAHADSYRELAALLAAIQARMAEGLPATAIAVLVRTNAQLVPLESAFTAAGIPFTVRGLRFFARPEVRAARQALRREPGAGSLSRVVADRWRAALGFDEQAPAGPGAEGRERHASLLTLLTIARQLEAEEPEVSVAGYLDELARRDAEEAAASGEGVVLSTYHRAKGLEWEAVMLPMLEEGTLPIRQAMNDPQAVEEERRLLYVGITRARRHLLLSWALHRNNAKGQSVAARASRFIALLRPNAVARSAAVTRTPTALDGVEPLFEALRTWRLTRSRADGVPAFIVADNRTLAAIAASSPASEHELLAVPGIGPQKLAAYGEEILAVIAAARADGS